MPVFPTSFIEQVRTSTDILDLVGNYVPLKRAGKNFKGLCPFHAEKTPSFNVSPEREIFHCFGCGQGGDAFKFLMLYEKMSFTEAVTHLAARAGISPPQRSVAPEDRERGLLVKLYEEAARLFQELLGKNPRALGYLEGRGLTRDMIEKAGFGYAPDSWSTLLDHLTRKGAKPDAIARAGLAVPRREGGGYYDRFRNRVVIPIRNESGKIVAFGGRLLGPGEPKYLNSPESPIYNKSRILYGFDIAKTAIRQTGFAILMEGYLDCIQAYQAGIEHAVACCGTSLTAAHSRLLRRYTDRVVVNFDPDAAGEAAAARSIDLLIEEGFQVSVLSLPPGKDPDRFIREEGGARYRERLEGARSFVDYLIDRSARSADITTPRGKVDFLNGVLPTLARIPNQVERVGYVSRLAERAEISDAAVVEELRRQVLARAHRVDMTPPPPDPVKPAERDLIRWLLHSPDDAPALLEDVDEEDLEGLATAPIFKAMKEVLASERLSTERVLDRLAGEAERNLLTRIALEPAPLGPRQSPRDCLNRLREQRWRRQLSRLRAKLAQGSDDDSLTAEIQSLARRIESSGRMESLN
ncbi:MAG TPA: DNA primase [Vicinamibacteria bacterium]|jgi:DNA primase